jgi:hypothetical protein
VKRCVEIEPTIGVLSCHAMVFREAAPQLRAAGVPVLHDAPLQLPLGNTRRQFVDGARAALRVVGRGA